MVENIDKSILILISLLFIIGLFSSVSTFNSSPDIRNQ